MFRFETERVLSIQCSCIVLYTVYNLYTVQALQHVFPMRGQMAQEKAIACAGRRGDFGRRHAREHEVLGTLAKAVECERLFEKFEAGGEQACGSAAQPRRHRSESIGGRLQRAALRRQQRQRELRREHRLRHWELRARHRQRQLRRQCRRPVGVHGVQCWRLKRRWQRECFATRQHSSDINEQLAFAQSPEGSIAE